MRLELCDVWAAPPGAADPVVRGRSLAVNSGEWVALEGPNGSGKTTLLLVAAGLRTPARGRRAMEAGAPPAGRTGPHPRIATILQDPAIQLLQPSVAEEIGLTLLNLGASPGEAASAAREWAGFVGLAGDSAQAPQGLSAGGQQLVLIAAALATRPDFLVADEPGAHLDPEARARVLDLVRNEVRRGMGVLWVTQNPDERAAADRVVALGEVFPPEPAGIESASGEVAGPALMRLRVGASGTEAGPRVQAREPFELRVAAGGVTTVTGANGAGKTVLLACAAGVLQCAQVERILDLPCEPPPLLVSEYPERQVFEDIVGREVSYAATRRGLERGEALDRAARLFSRLGLPGRDFLIRRTWEMSAGEKRLVLMVAGLIAPAGLLILDEPTAGLDPHRRGILGELVAERAGEGPVLVAGQDPGWMDRLASTRVHLPS